MHLLTLSKTPKKITEHKNMNSHPWLQSLSADSSGGSWCFARKEKIIILRDYSFCQKCRLQVLVMV